MRKVFFSKKILYLILVLLFFSFIPAKSFAVDLRNSATYSSDYNNIFWFLVISDTHIGDEIEYENKFKWILNNAQNTINPDFIVNTGDLVNATKGGIPPWYGLDVQQKDEWFSYYNIVKDLDPTKYYDLPGNHDRYGDTTWSDTTMIGLFDSTDSTHYGYKINSLHGSNSNPTGQLSWTYTLPNGDTYLFITANTCDSTGVPFSEYSLGIILGTISDEPELSKVERDYIKNSLINFDKDPNHKLSFIFGHAPIYRLTTILSPLEYFLNEVGAKRGGPEFVDLLNEYQVSAYIFGHTHKDRDLYDLKDHEGSKISSRLINTSSLSAQGTFRLVAVDNNGISMRTFKLSQLPAVLTTFPLDVKYAKLNSSPNLKSNYGSFVRAIAFDSFGVDKVRFRYRRNGLLGLWSDWKEMNNVAENIWQGFWNNSLLRNGAYELEVSIVSKSGKEDSHITNIQLGDENELAMIVNGFKDFQ